MPLSESYSTPTRTKTKKKKKKKKRKKERKKESEQASKAMVTFVCEQCNESLKKQKVENHRYRCGGRYARFACVGKRRERERDGDDYDDDDDEERERERRERGIQGERERERERERESECVCVPVRSARERLPSERTHQTTRPDLAVRSVYVPTH
ncbi:hypothetical protein DFJ73DRAFT_15630 [Zopfochytrium polystomum]|nr:hypothetical protein DFJ73DRAFT_15630 [Zopfochytrium polystomum]